MKFFLFGCLGAMALTVSSAMAESACDDTPQALSPFSVVTTGARSAHKWAFIFGSYLPEGYDKIADEKVSDLLDIVDSNGTAIAQSLYGQLPHDGGHYTVFKDNLLIASAITGQDKDGDEIETVPLKICGKEVAKQETPKAIVGDKQAYTVEFADGAKLTYQLARQQPALIGQTSTTLTEDIANEGKIIAKISEHFEQKARQGTRITEVKVEPIDGGTFDQRLAELLATQIFTRFR